MIPQKLHYAWFGGGTKSPLVEKCVSSFKQHCPEFEIVEWNERNFDISRHPFAVHAANHKKWAFVSDVCRAVVMKEQGGFFLDADNELTSNIQQFRGFDFVSGAESYKGIIYPITAFMGCHPGTKIADYIFNYYQQLADFRFEPNTVFISKHLVHDCGFIPDNSLQCLDRNLIAPSWYFCTPVNTKRNYCIHHFNGSWVQS
ncbi:MAG: glycosyltransferase [Methylobacterium frigidaeris]